MSYVIKLCSRNQTSPYAVTRATITTNVRNAFSFVEKLDESLDVGTMVVRGLTTRDTYDMFNWIELYEDTTLLYSMRIAGDNVRLISKNPKRYEHTLSLVEHTKILERFLVSGKTFTQPTQAGTVNYYIYDVLDDLINTTPLETANNESTTRIITLPTSGDLYDLLTTEISPEFTFKDLTLRECFNQVGGYIDGIPRLFINSSDELELTFDFVNELNDLITSTSDFIQETAQQDIEFYATEIESEALNLVNDEQIGESVEVYPSKDAFITARCDEFIFDFTKSYIPTPKPIYKIEQLICRVDVTTTDSSGGSGPVTVYDDEINIDLAKDWGSGTRVVEKKIYQVLDTSTTGVTNPDNVYKTNTIYYTDREQNITQNDNYGVFGTGLSIDNLIKIAVFRKLKDDGIIGAGTSYTSISTTINDNEKNYKYQVYYVPVPDSMRLSVSRQDLSDVKYNSSILSNQQSRLVNLEHFTNNLQGRINRIGNEDLQLEHRVTSFSDLYDIGDYTSDLYIVTVRELIFFNDYIYAKYALTKNYNMISKFIGVNTEIRQFDMGEKNTLQRNLIYKEYVEIDAVASGSGSDSSEWLDPDGIKSYLRTFDTSSVLEPVRSAFVQGDDFTETILIPTSSNGGGNALIFNMGFEDNKSAGALRNTISSQIAMDYVEYTDEDGFSENFTFYLYNKFDFSSLTETQIDTIAEDLPKSNLTYADTLLIKNQNKLQVYKDAREIIRLTFILQFVSDPSVVVLGRWFALRNRLVSENPPTTVKVWYSSTQTIGRTNNLKLDTTNYTQVSSPTITVDDTTNYNVTVSGSGLNSSVTSWVMTDENNYILLGVNQDGELLDTITFDFVNKRSDVNYKY